MLAILSHCAPTADKSLSASQGSFAGDPRLERGVSWQLAEYRKRTLSAIEYDFTLSIPSELSVPISGEATLRFQYNAQTPRKQTSQEKQTSWVKKKRQTSQGKACTASNFRW